MKKRLCIVLALILCAAALSGCGGNKLPEGFDEARVMEAAERAVITFSDGDYEGFGQLCAEGVRKSLAPEVLEAAAAQVMPNAGEFEKFTSEAAAGQKDAAGEDCVVAVLVAKYSGQTVTYTISLDKELMLIGFYLK